MRKLLVVLVLGVMVSAFASRFGGDDPVPVPASPQRVGDAKKGFEYLITGDYVRSGIPYNAFLFGAGVAPKNYLNRQGLNKNISYQYTAIKASNGEVLVAPNCLQCHAQIFDDQLIVGLGNSLADFTPNEKLRASNFELLEKILKANAPKQYEAAEAFLTVSKTITPHLYAASKGVNVADHLTAALAAHRDPASFRWINEEQIPIPSNVVPTDTPPWWLLKKKHAMFYNGFGRGDFGRFLMASNLFTVHDTSESRQVDEHMPDLLAYIYSIQPPKYRGTINQSLASEGKILFEKNCSSCHGHYGEKESYPNLLIPESIVLTDSTLNQTNYSSPDFLNWFNKSWFTQGSHPARLEPYNGYIAPPLDGVWITAPYLHNGSVPNLECLLDSKQRPRYWSRDFDHPEYDYENVGWKYKEEKSAGNVSTYNTELRGYGNYGHYFGDALTEKERKAVIEYLKTL